MTLLPHNSQIIIGKGGSITDDERVIEIPLSIQNSEVHHTGKYIIGEIIRRIIIIDNRTLNLYIAVVSRYIKGIMVATMITIQTCFAK